MARGFPDSVAAMELSPATSQEGQRGKQSQKKEIT